MLWPQHISRSRAAKQCRDHHSAENELSTVPHGAWTVPASNEPLTRSEFERNWGSLNTWLVLCRLCAVVPACYDARAVRTAQPALPPLVPLLVSPAPLVARRPPQIGRQRSRALIRPALLPLPLLPHPRISWMPVALRELC